MSRLRQVNYRSCNFFFLFLQVLIHFFIVYHRWMSLAQNEQEKKGMINWMLTGYIPIYNAPPSMTPGLIIERLNKRRNTMKSRGKGSNKRQFISEDELIDLYISSGGQCQITNRRYYQQLSIEDTVNNYQSKILTHITAFPVPGK